MKRTIVMSLLAVLLIPMAASAQVEAPPVAPAARKYEAYVGVAYSRLKQVPLSYSGIIGGKAALSRDFGRYFQLTGSVDYYKMGIGHSGLTNRGNPSIYTFMVGPGVHAPLFGNVSVEVFAEIGGEHTGGEKMTPNISFAGGFGGGLAYSLGHNLSLKLTGDRVGASFSLPNNSPQLAYSTNRTWNARGTFGVAYRF